MSMSKLNEAQVKTAMRLIESRDSKVHRLCAFNDMWGGRDRLGRTHAEPGRGREDPRPKADQKQQYPQPVPHRRSPPGGTSADPARLFARARRIQDSGFGIQGDEEDYSLRGAGGAPFFLP